jgi:hypothetical protein
MDPPIPSVHGLGLMICNPAHFLNGNVNLPRLSFATVHAVFFICLT